VSAVESHGSFQSGRKPRWPRRISLLSTKCRCRGRCYWSPCRLQAGLICGPPTLLSTPATMWSAEGN
jgi:hypothetical protein